MAERDEQFDPVEQRLWRQAAGEPPEVGDCPDEQALAAWLDGWGSVAETAAVELHLTVCPRCVQTVQDLRELLSAGAMPAPADAIARAQALVTGGPVRARRIGWLTSAGRWAAAAAVVLAVSYTGYRTGSASFLPDHSDSESAALAREATGLADPDQAVLDGEDMLVAMGGEP